MGVKKNVKTISIIFSVMILGLCLPYLGYGEADTRYNTALNLPFNEKAGDVNPQTGDITLSFTDVHLPGRAGYDFTFGRVWSLTQANVFNMYYKDGENYLNANTVERRSRMGVGWSTNLPLLVENTDTQHTVLYLFFGGGVYEVDRTGVLVRNENKSNLVGYDLLDKRIYKDSGVDYGMFDTSGHGVVLSTLITQYGLSDTAADRSAYLLILKDNEKYWFRPDGQVMMQEDRSGLNRIWYLYEADGAGGKRLKLVVDSVGRQIQLSYTVQGNLESIAWEVSIGQKDALGVRSRGTEIRSVQYSYQNAEDLFYTPAEWAAWAAAVLDYRSPYLLVGVKGPQDQAEGTETRYEYSAGKGTFSFDKVNAGYRENLYLMPASITERYSAGGYRSKRVFEYEQPVEGNHTKHFYTGFMEYYKLSRQYWLDRQGNTVNDTRYTYYDEGEGGNYNQYQAVIERGEVKYTYTYSLSDAPNQKNVLDRLLVESRDGFMELRDYVYYNDRTKKGEEVSRKGRWVYRERYQYDSKGNLKFHQDRVGLETTRKYDAVYSIPVEEVKAVTVGGQSKAYKQEREINTLGQVIKEIVYVEQSDGSRRGIEEARYGYDAYGNVITVTDALGQVVHRVYDQATHSYPLKEYEAVGVADWGPGGLEANWKGDPLGDKRVRVRSWRVYNSNGQVWIEVDSEGHAVEHYYNKDGEEVEVVYPDGDDVVDFAVEVEVDAAGNPLNPAVVFDDFEQNSHFPAFLLSRQNNPAERKEIDYQADLVKIHTDLDVSKGEVKVTGVQGDGLGHVEEEIEYGTAGVEYSVKRMAYDDQGRMIALTDPDAEGPPVTVVVQGSSVEKYDKTWIVKYDALGRKKLVIYPQTEEGKIPPIKQYLYDDVANTTTVIDEERRKVVEKRDWNGNVVGLVRYGDYATQENERQEYRYGYDELNRRVTVTDPQGIETRYRYDERDLLVEQEYVGEVAAETTRDRMDYDEVGRLIKKVDRQGQVVGYAYDELGRNTAEVYYGSEEAYALAVELGRVRRDYDGRGNVVRVENEALIEHYAYDHANRLDQVERKLKDTLAAVRTRIGQAVWGGDPDPVFSFSYQHNDAGMVTEVEYPNGGVHVLSYDGVLGRLESIQEGADRLSLAPFVQALQYNRAGVVTEMQYSNQTVQRWDFDHRKRIKRIGVGYTGGVEEQVLSDLRYQLNGVGDILGINDHEYTYDGFDRLVGAKTLLPTEADPQKRDVRKLVGECFGAYQGEAPLVMDGQIREYAAEADLNSDGRINGIDHTMASFIKEEDLYDRERFSYDRNGNRIELMQNGVKYRYEYGGRNRLERIYVKPTPGSPEELYIEYYYDENGNLTQRNVHTEQPQVRITLYEYDVMNRLMKTLEGGAQTEYYYDGVGNRFLKLGPNGEVTLYLRHGQIAVAMDVELPPSDETGYKGKVNRYVLSGDLLAGRITTTVNPDNSTTTAKSWYHLDHLNSTKLVTDAAGAVEVRYAYRAFGEQLAKLGEGEATYTYSGKELDEGTGLYYYGARYYDASIGRFITLDPIQDGTNFYLYCENNPLSYKDPTGLFGLGALIGGFAGATKGVVREVQAGNSLSVGSVLRVGAMATAGAAKGAVVEYTTYVTAAAAAGAVASGGAGTPAVVAAGAFAGVAAGAVSGFVAGTLDSIVEQALYDDKVDMRAAFREGKEDAIWGGIGGAVGGASVGYAKDAGMYAGSVLQQASEEIGGAVARGGDIVSVGTAVADTIMDTHSAESGGGLTNSNMERIPTDLEK